MKKREKIPYTDELADAIIAEHNLAASVKRVWKNRGHIPGDYLDENRDDSAKLSDNDPEYRRFIDILSRTEIAATKFRTLGQKGADVQREKDRMSEAERLGFKTEITELRNKLRMAKDVPTTKNMYVALSDLRLKPTKMISAALYSKLQRGSELKDYEKNDVRVAILALYNHLRL